PELREKLGVIRTEELLAARQVDHASQFFTRAVDFGFSKNAEETLRFWDHDKILSDVVWIIRRFRPDVVVTRFSPEDQLTHGHHTASAIIAQEAFAAAADERRFPEQLKFLPKWKPWRLVWNTSPFFFSNRNIPFDQAGLTTMEAGGFNPLLGRAYTELAAASVSMHKSQGVGSPPRRGARKEYFKPLAGEPMKNGLFDGVDATWNRVQAPEVSEKVQQIISHFRPDDPASSVPALLELRKAVEQVKDLDWMPRKRGELDPLIAACAGLYIECSTATAVTNPDQAVPVKLEAINRSGVAVTLKRVRFPLSGEEQTIEMALARDQLVSKDFTPKLPAATEYSQPYWLRKPGTVGTFAVDDQQLIGLPENPPHLPAEIVIAVDGQDLTFTLDTKYKTVDPVAGEVRESLVIAPPVFANFDDNVLVFPNGEAKRERVRVMATTGPVKGDLQLRAPAGWKIEPATVPIDLKGAGTEMVASFTVKPPAGEEEGIMAAVVSTGGKEYSFSRVRISYPHIGTHILMPPAECKLVRANIQTKGHLIGYIPGAGDDVPQALEQMGYQVKLLTDDDINARNLAQFSAVVFGVRAYNTHDNIENWLPQVFQYVKNGGVAVAQYNTTAELKTKTLGPFPLDLSRDRVTDETAEVTVLAKDHPVMNVPNKITAKDFDGWVQERGLYFPNKWDPAWKPILSCHDPKEKPMDGGLLVAQSGKGYFVYTGYSWFR
ncbi:MAG TPA: PIG-L family deacetylase, partial [Chthoniobacterales bacterium]